jgi:Uma2 family endonuclease
MAVQPTRRVFTVDDYHRMVGAGILSERDRVELINGEVLAMTPIGPPHGAAVDRANRAMVTAVGDRAIVRIQGSVRLNEYNEPQPDIVLLRPQADFYASRLPGPSDILLIVEIAQSSLEYDRTVKAQLYAETGVVEYWLADLGHECLFVHSDPRIGKYRTVRELHRGEAVAPQFLPDCQLPIAALLA